MLINEKYMQFCDYIDFFIDFIIEWMENEGKCLKSKDFLENESICLKYV